MIILFFSVISDLEEELWDESDNPVLRQLG